MKYLVIRTHNPESGGYLKAAVNDELDFERRETIYPGWIWCTDKNDVQAWVPEAFVSITGSTCRMLRDYCSREIEVRVGDRVEVLETESGWAWVMDHNQERGWTPMDCLEHAAP
jgi:hypothetical protein